MCVTHVLQLGAHYCICIIAGDMAGVFKGCYIALELGTNVPFAIKQRIRKSITANDGVVSFIINKKVCL